MGGRKHADMVTALIDVSALAPSKPSLSDGSGRYEELGRLGLGGMGTVERVQDRKLSRIVAMKLLKAELARDQRACQRFHREASITAALQHPGIVPIYDLGKLDDGRLYLTMPEIEGQTLREAYWDMPLRQQMSTLRSVCEAVGYAHAMGVIHRDLKPSNIMVGSHGQVFVLDWGLAKLLDEIPTEDALATRAGFVLGTPAYMSPEQAAGDVDLMSPASDQFALGCIMYEIMTGRVPIDAADPRELLRKMVRGGRDPLPSTLPADLRQICDRALENEIADRFPDAESMAAALGDWLENSRQQRIAQDQVAHARQQRDEALALRQHALQERRRAQQLLHQCHPSDPIPLKRPAWEAEARAVELEQQADRTDLSWQQTVATSLQHDPTLKEAHALLAVHYRRTLVQAEEGRDHAGAERAEARLRSHDRGEHAEWLQGHATLSISTDPEGGTLRIYRYAHEDRRLTPQSVRTMSAPVRDLRLPHGSYLVEIERGPARMRLPLRIRRCQDCDVGRVRVPQDLGPDDVWVAPGAFRSGGDPAALDSLPQRVLYCDGFVIRRHPTTNAEYILFLDELVARRTPAEAFARCPRTPHGDLLYDYAHGHFALADGADGDQWDLQSPVVCISQEDALAYCRWLSERNGHVWRLPMALEWEKAARGVDGRLHPWGDHLDATWCVIRNHFRDRPQIQPIDACPEDVSPYGVRGLGGNVRDLCADATFDPPVARASAEHGSVDGYVVVRPTAGETTTTKGGSWLGGAPSVRCASRHRTGPTHVSPECGFRIARSGRPA